MSPTETGPFCLSHNVQNCIVRPGGTSKSLSATILSEPSAKASTIAPGDMSPVCITAIIMGLGVARPAINPTVTASTSEAAAPAKLVPRQNPRFDQTRSRKLGAASTTPGRPILDSILFQSTGEGRAGVAVE